MSPVILNLGTRWTWAVKSFSNILAAIRIVADGIVSTDIIFGFLNPEDRRDGLSRNVRKKLALLAAG